MGTIRLGRLPDTQPWRKVVEQIAAGASAAIVAGSTSAAAVRGLERGRWDRGVACVIYLLSHAAVAARKDDFSGALQHIGLSVPVEPTLFDLTSGFMAAFQNWRSCCPGEYTDLGEMATLAGAESLTACVGDRARGLFPTGEEVQTAVRDFSTLNGFAAFGHDYFARFTRRFLLYHLGRELSQHVGSCGRFANPAAHTQFVADLDTHCREATTVVREFVGKWYNRANFTNGISEASARGFSAKSLEKIQNELARRGGFGG
jgi:hypothetical protein